MSQCFLFTVDDLDVLSGSGCLLIWISFLYSLVLFLKTPTPLLCPVSDVGNATPPSGSGLLMFFISFTCACLSVTVTVARASRPVEHIIVCVKTTKCRQIELEFQIPYYYYWVKVSSDYICRGWHSLSKTLVISGCFTVSSCDSFQVWNFLWLTTQWLFIMVEIRLITWGIWGYSFFYW